MTSVFIKNHEIFHLMMKDFKDVQTIGDLNVDYVKHDDAYSFVNKKIKSLYTHKYIHSKE